VDYAIAMVITTIFGAILWSFTHWSFETLCVAAVLLFVPLVPAVTRLGRVVWIYVDQLIDPRR
jgi:large-conductance mechanosensitive channel